ncbi:hypothetical protein GUJ93_ZPchr0006g41347 [Zizania palustris]|uniref:Uncharacterized protein n=1 Tax=Zizania palustris TaxID=103762 RepID=A0A8J5VL73_ZIZPA|nr:hypothetical protein GUJ93_ZPchr0006g41347 [Zizania palustris]
MFSALSRRPSTSECSTHEGMGPDLTMGIAFEQSGSGEMAGKRGKALLAARTMAAESAEKDNREKAAVSHSSHPSLQSLAAWPLYAPAVGGGLPSVRSPLFLRAGDSSSIDQISSARLPER